MVASWGGTGGLLGGAIFWTLQVPLQISELSVPSPPFPALGHWLRPSFLPGTQPSCSPGSCQVSPFGDPGNPASFPSSLLEQGEETQKQPDKVP